MSPIESRIIKTLESGPRSVQEIYEAACCSESIWTPMVAPEVQTLRDAA